MDAVLEYSQGTKLRMGIRISCVRSITVLPYNYKPRYFLVPVQYKSIWRKVISVLKLLSCIKKMQFTMKIAGISVCNWGLAAFLLRVKYSLGVNGLTLVKKLLPSSILQRRYSSISNSLKALLVSHVGKWK